MWRFDLSGDGLTTPLDTLLVINAANQSVSPADYPATYLNDDNSIDFVDADLAMSPDVDAAMACFLCSLPSPR